MTKNDALLPCPFCGAKAHVKTHYFDGDMSRTYISCPDMECAGYRAASKPEQWNTRPTPAPLEKGDEVMALELLFKEAIERYCAQANWYSEPHRFTPFIKEYAERAALTPSPVAVDAKAGEMQKLWQIVHVQDTPEDEAAFMVNMLRGQIKIPQSVKDRIYWAEHEKREALTAPKPDSKE